MGELCLAHFNLEHQQLCGDAELLRVMQEGECAKAVGSGFDYVFGMRNVLCMDPSLRFVLSLRTASEFLWLY